MNWNKDINIFVAVNKTEDHPFKTNRYPEKKTHTIEEIESFYQVFIEYNLRQAIKVYDTEYLHPKQLTFRHNDRQLDSTNPYLTEYGDQKLGLDILNNGTYWPLIVMPKYIESETFLVREGYHRGQAMQSLSKQSLWPEERKTLAVIFPVRRFSIIHYQENPGMTIDPPTSLLRPYSDTCPNLYDNEERVTDNLVKMTIDNYYDFYMDYLYMPMYIQNYIFEIQKQTGYMIPPHQAINDEEYFKEWVKQPGLIPQYD